MIELFVLVCICAQFFLRAQGLVPPFLPRRKIQARELGAGLSLVALSVVQSRHTVRLAVVPSPTTRERGIVKSSNRKGILFDW